MSKIRPILNVTSTSQSHCGDPGFSVLGVVGCVAGVLGLDFFWLN